MFRNSRRGADLVHFEIYDLCRLMQPLGRGLIKVLLIVHYIHDSTVSPMILTLDHLHLHLTRQPNAPPTPHAPITIASKAQVE